MPNFERKNRGVDAEMKVGIIEWRIVDGAIESGRIHDGRALRAVKKDRGG